jgi:hypothetical protein
MRGYFLTLGTTGVASFTHTVLGPIIIVAVIRNSNQNISHNWKRNWLVNRQVFRNHNEDIQLQFDIYALSWKAADGVWDLLPSLHFVKAI